MILTLIALAALPSSQEAPSRYPALWWQPVSSTDVPAWEILPQSAKPPEVIVSKRNELGLLSNFAPTPFVLDGVRYASVEGFWQSLLYPEGENDPRLAAGKWPHTRAEVAALSAFEAKRAGDDAKKLLAPLGIKWVSYQKQQLDYKGRDQEAHYALIRRAMQAKLDQNLRVREILLATGDLTLLPDHTQPADKTRAYDYTGIWTELRTALRASEMKKAEVALAHWSADNRARIADAVERAYADTARVAVFDGDGTLWHADVPREFLEFQVQKRHLKYFDYSMDALATGQRLYDTCKTDVPICIAQAAYLNVGIPVPELERHMADFYSRFNDKIFAGQVELVRFLRERGFTVWLVSGGPKWLAEPAAKKWFGIAPENVIGVVTKVAGGVMSAEVVPPLPFREGKIQAIRTLLGKDVHIAAGNTGSDVPMLELAAHLAIAINSFGPETKGFHHKAEQDLIQVAQARGWLVQGF